MALNITIDGYCRLNDDALSNVNVKYQGLFEPNGTASSPTTWNNVRAVEATGYWNINLGDADWLTQDGTALNNAKVIIVFWKGTPLGDDRNALCSVLEEWGAFEITLDGSSVYTNTTQVKANIYPVLAWSLPSTGYVDTSYTATNNSYDVHNWTISGTNMYHWRTRYGENIQLINTVSGTDYDWDDGNKDLGVAGTTNMSHQWTSAGSYDVEIVIYDECSTTVTGVKTIDISWHAPVPDIIMSPSVPDPNEPVSFQWNGTDADNQITDISWIVTDSGTYGNTSTTASGARDEVIPHSSGTGTDWCGTTVSGGAFTNPGTHNVSIVYTWYDGSSWHNDPYNEVFSQARFSGPTVNFSQDPAQATITSGVKFTNISTSISRVGLGLPDCDEYDWTFTDDGSATDYLDKPYSYELEVTPGSADCQVNLCANWSDGWDTNQTCTEKDVVFETLVTVTSEECYYNLNVIGTADDGTVGGYSWSIDYGISQTGPWDILWQSPIGMDQQDKRIGFALDGWYQVTGYVHSSGAGATTSGSQILFVDVTCASGVAACGFIWNGTGILDEYGDWEHSHYGFEATYAKHSGTNGLDASGMTKNDKIEFDELTGGFDASRYDSLILWVNVQSWEEGKLTTLDFQEFNNSWGTSISLNSYINVTSSGTWQKAVVPLAYFDISSYIYKRLKITTAGNIGMYLDDMTFAIGSDVYYPVPIEEYDVYANEFALEPHITGDEQGMLHVTSDSDELALSVEVPSVAAPEADIYELKPNMRVRTD